jgi:lipopolysaccharide/colanic/teichoic acid biosynthesis glycosyltransferase
VVTVEHPAHPAVTSLVKRGFDAVLAAIGLVVSAPIMVLCIAAIRCTSRGPVIFRQERVGLDGQPFTIFKLRTMTVDGDDQRHREYSIHQFTERYPDRADNGSFKLDDPRVTTVGRILRALSLDEVPQLVNVLRGEMSLVGPRPMLDWEFDLVGGAHRDRVRTRPGMSGMWQVSGRSGLSTLEMLDLDIDYVDQWSLGLDLRILLKTPLALLSR